MGKDEDDGDDDEGDAEEEGKLDEEQQEEEEEAEAAAGEPALSDKRMAPRIKSRKGIKEKRQLTKEQHENARPE